MSARGSCCGESELRAARRNAPGSRGSSSGASSSSPSCSPVPGGALVIGAAGRSSVQAIRGGANWPCGAPRRFSGDEVLQLRVPDLRHFRSQCPRVIGCDPCRAQRIRRTRDLAPSMPRLTEVVKARADSCAGTKHGKYPLPARLLLPFDRHVFHAPGSKMALREFDGAVNSWNPRRSERIDLPTRRDSNAIPSCWRSSSVPPP
jgi:hypothetical protein